MCVIFWTVDDPHYHLVIASNRDEFLSRPTLPASWHNFSSPLTTTTTSASVSATCSSSDFVNQHTILSARDPAGGGTWLGVTRNGAFATLTNFTEISAPLPAGMTAFESRGQLVKDWLVAQTNSPTRRNMRLQEVKREIESYLQVVATKLDRFPGFNLLIGAISSQGTVVGYITNRTLEGKLTKQRKPDIFEPQLTHPSPNPDVKATSESSPLNTNSRTSPPLPGGMSNSVLTQPWAKVTSGSLAFTSALTNASRFLPDKNAAETRLIEELFDVLWTSSYPTPSQRSELRNSILISPLELPAHPSTQAQSKDWYATRTSTVILLGRDGRCKLVERDTFKVMGDKAVLINGPEARGAINGRNGGERVFEWQLE